MRAVEESIVGRHEVPRMKTGRILLLLLVLLALLVALPATFLYLIDRDLRAAVGPEHTFPLAEPPPFLTEELALAKAHEALVLDGVDPSDWSLQESWESAAPDGRTDRFMTR